MAAHPLRFWWLGASALLVCVGSLGPWAKVLIFTAGGLDADGGVTLAAGIAALVAFGLYVRSTVRPRPAWPLAVAGLAGLVAAGTGAYDWSRLNAALDVPAEPGEVFGLDSVVSVGWGLVLVTVAGLSLLAAATAVWAGRHGEPAHMTVYHLAAPSRAPEPSRGPARVVDPPRGPARVVPEPDAPSRDEHAA